MSSNLSITGVETIKRQTRAAYGWLVVGQSVDASLAYTLYANSVCNMNSAAAAVVCGLWRYTSVICLCLCISHQWGAVHMYFYVFISTLCKSFVFSTNLRVRAQKTILVRVSSCQIRKFNMAAKIQDGCQFPPFCRITPYNFSTIAHKIAILVDIHTFACISN